MKTGIFLAVLFLQLAHAASPQALSDRVNVEIDNLDKLEMELEIRTKVETNFGKTKLANLQEIRGDEIPKLHEIVGAASLTTLSNLENFLQEKLKSTPINHASLIMHLSPIFREYQGRRLVEEAIKEKYYSILWCLMYVGFPWEESLEERHWFLDFSCDKPWFDPELLMGHKDHLDMGEFLQYVLEQGNIIAWLDNLYFFKAAPKWKEELLPEWSESLSSKLGQLIKDKKAVSVLRRIAEHRIPIDFEDLKIEDALCGDALVVRMLHDIGYDAKISSKDLDQVAARGDLLLLQYLFLKSPSKNSLPTGKGITQATKNGHFGVLMWACRLNPELLPKAKVLWSTARNGDTLVVEWAYLDLRFFSDDSQLEWLMREGSLTAINWAYRKHPERLRNSNFVRWALLPEKSAVLQMLCDFQDPQLFAVIRQLVYSSGDLVLVKRLHSFNISPTESKDLDFALKGNDTEVLDYLYEQYPGWKPSQESACMALPNCKNSLNWLKEKFAIIPTKKQIDDAIAKSRLEKKMPHSKTRGRQL